jgi:hypothetical protein
MYNKKECGRLKAVKRVTGFGGGGEERGKKEEEAADDACLL